MNFNATVTSRFPTAMILFYGTTLDLYRENPAALGGESFSSSRDPGSGTTVQGPRNGIWFPRLFISVPFGADYHYVTKKRLTPQSA